MRGVLSYGAAHVRHQTEADKKLVYSLNRSGIPSWKQLRNMFQVLNSSTTSRQSVGWNYYRRTLSNLLAYLRNFTAVPTTGGEYTEGLIGAPQYINPLLSQTNDVDSDLVRLLFSGLLKYDEILQLYQTLLSAGKFPKKPTHSPLEMMRHGTMVNR